MTEVCKQYLAECTRQDERDLLWTRIEEQVRQELIDQMKPEQLSEKEQELEKTPKHQGEKAMVH